MCVYSMIVDHYRDKWEKQAKEYFETGLPFMPITIPDLPSREEVNEFRKLLEKARKYDEENGEKDCELEEKKEKVKELAKKLGLDISSLGWN